MDIVINAAIQSPLFRNLSHVPADRLAFSYHLTSNAPPLSKTKITVEPSTAHNSLDATYQFRIPQFGFLSKVVIKLSYDIYPVTRFQVTPLLPLYHIIDDITLRSHNRPIQTIYGKECLVKHAYWSDPADKQAKILGTLNPPPGPGLIDLGELFKDPETGTPFNPIRDSGSWTTRKRRVHMMLEVPLASTSAPHVNFDTRFVEHLDLYVKLNSSNGNDPIGMAAGLLEQDLSQPFNKAVGGSQYKSGQASTVRTMRTRVRGFELRTFQGDTNTGEDASTVGTASRAAAGGTGYLFKYTNTSSKVYACDDDTGEIIANGTYYGFCTTPGYHQHALVENVREIDWTTDGSSAGLTQAWAAGTTIANPINMNPVGGLIGHSSAATPTDVTNAVSGFQAHRFWYQFVVASGVTTTVIKYQSGATLFPSGADMFPGLGEGAQAVTLLDTDGSGLTTKDAQSFDNATWTIFEVAAADKSDQLFPTNHYGPATEGSATGVASQLVDCSDVGSTTGVYAKRGILNYKTNMGISASATSVAKNGPVCADYYYETTSVNLNKRQLSGRFNSGNDNGARVGYPGIPCLPLNWVRLGSCNYTPGDYAGWGRAAATTENKLDYYTSGGTVNAEDDAQTAITVKQRVTDLWGTASSGMGSRNSAGDMFSPFFDEGSRFPVLLGWGVLDTAGKAFKKSLLERYYTLYPHLNYSRDTQALFQSSMAVAGTNATGGTAYTPDADYLPDPVLLGGNASGAVSGTQNSISRSHPMNIACTLSCTFLNYHDKIREDIATENFKDNAPATILMYDTQQELNNAIYGSSSSSFATAAYDEMIVPIKSNHLAYAISIIAFRNKSTSQLAGATARTAANRSVSTTKALTNDFGCQTNSNSISVASASEVPVQFPNYQVVENFKTVQPTYVALKGSGRPIYECGVDTNPKSSGINAEFANRAGAGRIAGAGSVLAEGDLDNLSWKYNTTEGNGPLQGTNGLGADFLSAQDRRIVGELSEHTGAHVVTFGLNPTDELASSGVLALQTVNNPTLHLRFPEECRVYVYVQ
jgi:hypothetical protein